MKIPVVIVYRINDLAVYSKLQSPAMTQYRLSVKRRLFIRCMRSYAELFSGRKEELCASKRYLKEPYLYNDLLEDDQFARTVTADDNIPNQPCEMNNADAMKQLTQEGVKIQLADMFKAICASFDEIKHKL